MGVKDSLPRSFPAVRADVYSLRLKPILYQGLHFPNEIEEIDVFLRRQFPNRGNMALWNHKRMPWGDWKAVEEC